MIAGNVAAKTSAAAAGDAALFPDVATCEDDEALQSMLSQLTDHRPETYEKRKAVRQRIVDLKTRAREKREAERQERERRREEESAKRRRERESERKERLQRIQELSKTRPDPASTSQEFLKKRRDSATKFRQQEIQAISQASLTKQKSIAEESREEEMRVKIELAKKDRERQMECMQDIRRMSLTGAAWKSASPSLHPSSLLALSRSPTSLPAKETIIRNQNENERVDDDKAAPTNLNSVAPALGGISEPAKTQVTNTTLLLSPQSGNKGLRATIQSMSNGEKGLTEERRGYPNAPALRRTSRSWTIPRQSGTEFRRNSRVQPTSVADAKRRFEEVDKKSNDSAVSRSQSFSPASAASSAVQIKATLLAWCQQKTRGYPHVDIRNFSSSWADGMAFAAIAHHYSSDAFDFHKLDPKNRRENLEIAFRVADETIGAMPLLEVDDMLAMKDKPDWKCVFTYVQSLYRHGRDYENKIKAEQ